VATTIPLPDELDGATLQAYAVPEGVALTAGETLAVYELDGERRDFVVEADCVLLKALGRPGRQIGAGAPVAIVGENGEVIGYDASLVRPVRLMVQRRCNECGSDYPVNGLVDRAKCLRCGEGHRVSPAFWRTYLAEDVATARAPGEVSGGTMLGEHGACTRSCWGIPPLCRSCTTLLSWDAIVQSWDEAHTSGSATFHCGECGEAHLTRPPPDWATEVFPGLVFLVGETATGRESASPARPVIFKCPLCLAPLQVDGARRIIRCRFCEADVYLPDDLWIHLNPGAKRARWWMLFRPQALAPCER
jgi:predicted RNA-binding Zn-ribbon protein involved in translation (DUF1610 family)